MKKNPLKVSIITPNLNGGLYIEETIKSVINQIGIDLEYIVVDGESKDNSIEIIKKYKKKIAKFIIQKDNNMYEAIERGLKYCTGDYVGWLASDDFFYSNRSLFLATKKMKKNNIHWANGINSKFKNKKIISNIIPYYFPQKYILNGRCHKSDYGFIPQESVLFSKHLIKKVKINTKNYASGDYFLWTDMAKFSKLHPINVRIGVFRVRQNQVSENLDSYYKEINKIFKPSINFKRYFYSLTYYLISFFFRKDKINK